MTSERGMTLIEVAIVLVVTLTIMGALAPSLSAVVRHAETTSATTGMNTIRDAILSMLTDTNQSRFTIDGTGNGTAVNLLVSDGDTPRQVAGSGSTSWQAAVNNTTGLTDFLERHLILNDPRGNAANGYSTTSGSPWRGAYMVAPIDPDPWGNRYMVNTQHLGNADKNDVVVYSAGPDSVIDTAFTSDPLAAGNDDLIVLVEA